MGKLSRNAPCWCGSEEKYKYCHYPQVASEKDVIDSLFKEKTPEPSFEEFQKIMNMPKAYFSIDEAYEKISGISKQRETNSRHKPSQKIIDISNLLSIEKRKSIIDISAQYVDNNWCGRSEMCLQFAILVKNLLRKEGIKSKIIEGKATYFYQDSNFSWNHFWLVTENSELIDCNIDSLPENPYCTEVLMAKNYWGPLNSIPEDREYSEKKEFTENDEEMLEKQDDESLTWKKNSIKDYEDIWS
ncbi:MAG: SEC-C domain-containing protein [Paludibacter sp.]